MRRSHGCDVIPRQQFVDLGLFVPAYNGFQDGGQVAVRLDPVEFAGFDQGRDDGPVLCASVVPGEERVFAVQGDGTDGALDWVVIEFDAAVVEEQAKAIPVFGNVFQRLSGWGFGRDTGTTLGKPKLEGVDDRF